MYFLNQDSFHRNLSKHLKLGRSIGEGQMQGMVSQIFYLGFSCCFIKFRKISCKNSQKVSHLFYIESKLSPK